MTGESVVSEQLHNISCGRAFTMHLIYLPQVRKGLVTCACNITDTMQQSNMRTYDTSYLVIIMQCYGHYPGHNSHSIA